MAAAEAVRALALVATLALAYSGRLSLALLALLAFVGACGTVAYSVAAPALVPALVPPAGLAAANARLELARTVAFVGGPALAGALVGWTGAGAAFGVAAGLSIGAVFLLAGLREPPRAPAPASHTLQDLREGSGFVFRHPLLLPILITQFVFNTAFFVLQAVYVPYAVHQLGLSASGVGVTLAIYGVGMVVGALLAGWIIRALPFGVVIVIGPLAGLAAAVVMVCTIWLPAPALAGVSFFLFGVGPILWTIGTTTLRQMGTPSLLLGRVSAINIATYGSRPLGAAVGALVGGLYGAETGLVVAAAGFLIQAVVILVSPVRRLARHSEMVG
jgi:predicted MFS family arabinose efflux permease